MFSNLERLLEISKKPIFVQIDYRGIRKASYTDLNGKIFIIESLEYFLNLLKTIDFRTESKTDGWNYTIANTEIKTNPPQDKIEKWLQERPERTMKIFRGNGGISIILVSFFMSCEETKKPDLEIYFQVRATTLKEALDELYKLL